MFSFFFLRLIFYLRERGNERARVGGGAEGGGSDQPRTVMWVEGVALGKFQDPRQPKKSRHGLA